MFSDVGTAQAWRAYTVPQKPLESDSEDKAKTNQSQGHELIPISALFREVTQEVKHSG